MGKNKKPSTGWWWWVPIWALLPTLLCSCTGFAVKARPNPALAAPPKSAVEFGATPFVAYDTTVAEEIEHRWNGLLAQLSPPARPHPGIVRVTFKLMNDGKVRDVVVAKNEVGEPFGDICKEAILEGAPFARWPWKMRWQVGRRYREVAFSFRYR